MAIAQEDRHPITEIMQQTPDIPDSCQWAIFLRNHDELTLEMVTSKERDYMYQMYAADPRARINVGHPAPPGAAARERRRPHQADEQPAAVDARLADPLLRRRDRHGRQHLPRRPRRRAHADAVAAGAQRRVLARGSAAAVPAADHGPDLRLRGGQRRGAAARAVVAAQLDAPHAGRARGVPGFRPRQAHLPEARQPQDPRLPARVRRTRSSCAWPISRARRSRSSSISRRSRGACRWSSWAARRFRRSAICRTC